jgi:hypothetical protein
MRHCGEVIGVDEPLMLAAKDVGERQTSRAAEPGLMKLDGRHYHRACRPGAGSDGTAS